MLPVKWRGDGQEFVLLSGNSKEGGMIDGHLRRVVMFPEDGHPDLAANVMNLTGDQRDENVLWDQKRIWIYTRRIGHSMARRFTPQSATLITTNPITGRMCRCRAGSLLEHDQHFHLRFNDLARREHRNLAGPHQHVPQRAALIDLEILIVELHRNRGRRRRCMP
jgi:hypothetical protein